MVLVLSDKYIVLLLYLLYSIFKLFDIISGNFQNTF
jgi:hypothetical protein